MKRLFTSFAHYNLWAHDQIEQWCRTYLPATTPTATTTTTSLAAYDKDIQLPLKTFYNTLCHMWAAEQLWLCRLKGIGGSENGDGGNEDGMTSGDSSSTTIFGHPSLRMINDGRSHTPTIRINANKNKSTENTNTNDDNENPLCSSQSIHMLDEKTLATYWIDNHPNDGKFENIFRNVYNVVPSSSSSSSSSLSSSSTENTSSLRVPLTPQHIDDVFIALQDSGKELLGFVECFDDEQLNAAFDQVVNYKTTDGQTKQMVTSHILSHVLNHGTHHRGQLSTAATILVPTAKQIALDMPIFYLSNNKR